MQGTQLLPVPCSTALPWVTGDNHFALIPLVKWMGFGSLRPVLTPAGSRMLNAARESGMLTVWVGWDAISDDALTAYRADGKIGVDRERAIRTLRDHGIDVSLFYMLGGRNDSLDDFKRSVELADRLGVSMHPSLLAPYPGLNCGGSMNRTCIRILVGSITRAPMPSLIT